MRLSKIEFAGFKSFADPTRISFPSNLVGIVGPNGCGKSNVIDAVRWVMGESSAKQLRGESLADVIFNGSSHRKPVGQASVEMVFDNSDSTLGGEYASYSEISIKRVVDRESQSTYYLNGTRCRRKDITDIFLGTGLGPRSYAIIEQGMISRFIEAKPEDMRNFIEEAASVSKYKERRRETENKIRHTRENLDRLNDLREELSKQLAHLQKQAIAAEKYQELKTQERQYQAQLFVMRMKKYQQEILETNKVLYEYETQLHAIRTEQQHVETELTKLREHQLDANEAFNEVQKRFYALGAEIARLEESIQHHQARKSELETEQLALNSQWQEIEETLEADKFQLEDLVSENQNLEPEIELIEEKLELCKAELVAKEQQFNDWQMRWDEFNQASAQHSQTAQIEQTHIQHTEQQIIQAKERLQKFQMEKQRYAHAEIAEEVFEHEKQQAQLLEQQAQVQMTLDELQKKIIHYHSENERLQLELNDLRGQEQRAQGRLASLEALQQVAMGRDDNALIKWIEESGLTGKSRLAENIQAEAGWETALEVVLGHYLQAVCTDNIEPLQELLSQAPSSLSFISKSASQSAASLGSLQSKVRSSYDLSDLLSHVLVADDLAQAKVIQKSLLPHQSVITKEGIWLGRNWLRVTKKINQSEQGVLQREQEIDSLKLLLTDLQEKIALTSDALSLNKQELREQESNRDKEQVNLRQVEKQLAEVNAQIALKKDRIDQFMQRLKHINQESSDINEQITQLENDLILAREKWQTALMAMEEDAGLRESYLVERESYKANLDEARAQFSVLNEQHHQLSLRKETSQSQVGALEQSIARLAKQHEQISERREQIAEQLSHGGDPVYELKQTLQEVLEERVQIEAELTAAKQRRQEIEHQYNEYEEQRQTFESRLQQVRQSMEDLRLRKRELDVHLATIQENLLKAEINVEEVFQNLPQEANEAQWQQELDAINNRITRLGPINLAAIDEYTEQAKRKEFLDQQNADLMEALETLENAIKKIDKETRDKFKETFDLINQGFQELFPKVFGGGSASLELVGDELLNAGVTIMARPPGKRNSTIHLLSGGEKALTAISLVFAIFRLNPAPFCMLDEVDAPLDDANVGRYANLVKEMSANLQFIFISHNKGAIEMANHLCGVTMHEPGVSRIVAVDVEEAISMAEA